MWFSGFLKEKLSFCKYIPVVNFLYYMIDVSRPYVCGPTSKRHLVLHSYGTR